MTSPDRNTYTIRNANVSEHDMVLAVAKTSKYTRDFGSHMFSPPAAYEKGWIKVAMEHGKVLGMTCVRHKVREPVTMLYFVCVHPDHRSSFIGQRLLEAVMADSPHSVMKLNVMKDNDRAVQFYKRLGFKIVGEAMQGQAHQMSKDFDKSET